MQKKPIDSKKTIKRLNKTIRELRKAGIELKKKINLDRNEKNRLLAEIKTSDEIISKLRGEILHNNEMMVVMGNSNKYLLATVNEQQYSVNGELRRLRLVIENIKKDYLILPKATPENSGVG